MSISETIPTYRQLNSRGFFNDADMLINEGEAFEWMGVPNEHMEALNEPARKRLEDFYHHLEAGARELAEKNGRLYTGHVNDLSTRIAEATSDARRIEAFPGDGGVPLLRGSEPKKSEAKFKRVDLDAGVQVHRQKRTRGE